LFPSFRLLLLAKTITHAAARSLCDSWASCSVLRRQTDRRRYACLYQQHGPPTACNSHSQVRRHRYRAYTIMLFANRCSLKLILVCTLCYVNSYFFCLINNHITYHRRNGNCARSGLRQMITRDTRWSFALDENTSETDLKRTKSKMISGR